MSEYGDAEGGQVMHESYCMKKSIEARTVDEMSNKMGYHDMGDLANSKIYPVQMGKERRNEQNGPKMPGKRF